MSHLTRRRFLSLLGGGLGILGAVLTGCRKAGSMLGKSTSFSKEKVGSTPSSTPTAAKNSPDPTAAVEEKPLNTVEVQASPTVSSTPTTAYRPPHLAVTRNGSPQRLVKKAVKALGGMGEFVQSGDDVIIKPNICVAYHSYEYAATTNPWVVAALVELALGYGARRVRVMDNPFGGSAQQAYVRSGIQKAVEEAGGKMELMSDFKYVRKKIPEGKDLRECKIYQDVLQADVLINVPIIKHHGLARMTLSMKNLMGVIQNRPAMHHNLGQRLADLSTRVRSHLVVVDGVRMLMRHGPSGGNLGDVKKADTVIATTDVVAADSYAATLFGLKPNNLAYVRAGSAMGLGRSDLKNLKIEELDVG